MRGVRRGGDFDGWSSGRRGCGSRIIITAGGGWEKRHFFLSGARDGLKSESLFFWEGEGGVEKGVLGWRCTQV